MQETVLLIGNGAREHALAEALSKDHARIIALMSANNPGIIGLSAKQYIGAFDDKAILKRIIEDEKPTFAVIGPEAPLGRGVVDVLQAMGVQSVGPVAELAKLETSKAFTRHLMEKYKIDGMPRWRAFKSLHEIVSFINDIGTVVIKPDGLTGGKGVWVQGEHFSTTQDAVDYCKTVLETHHSVVVEEKLEGEEFSLQCLTDGTHVIATPPVQDHKRAFEGDSGSNTGGMGSYSCEDHLLPFLRQEHVDTALKITLQMVDALYKETEKRFKGVMYGGFILTKDGVKLIEYNARFGDPEAMNVLPLLETSFVDLCRAVIDGKLDKLDVTFAKKATVCKYVVPKGYPRKPLKGEKIIIGKSPARVYYASVDKRDDGLYLLGSRAVAFVGVADSISEAEQIAQQGVESVQGPIFFRSDIGTEKLLQKRIGHMKEIVSN
ncbi:MAG: phosphoribosylamine--glycine ligase [Nanoarchaeota archaeon]